MSKRRWVTTGVVAGSIGLGALVAGAVVAPGLGLAQTDGAEATEVVMGGWCFGDGDGPVVTAAAAIGIPTGDLLYAMQDGSTIAEVAEAEGVDTPVVIDAVRTSMQERLDEAVADGFISQELADRLSGDLQERANDFVNGDVPFLHHGPIGGHGPWGGGRFGDGDASDDANEATGVGLF